MAGLVERRRAPTVRGTNVELVLLDDEACAFEDVDPVVGRALQLPALVVALAGGDTHEQAAVLREHAAQLAKRGCIAILFVLRVDRVHRVVAADVLSVEMQKAKSNAPLSNGSSRTSATTERSPGTSASARSTPTNSSAPSALSPSRYAGSANA